MKWPQRRGQFWLQGQYLNNLCRGSLYNSTAVVIQSKYGYSSPTRITKSSTYYFIMWLINITRTPVDTRQLHDICAILRCVSIRMSCVVSCVASHVVRRIVCRFACRVSRGPRQGTYAATYDTKHTRRSDKRHDICEATYDIYRDIVFRRETRHNVTHVIRTNVKIKPDTHGFCLYFYKFIL